MKHVSTTIMLAALPLNLAFASTDCLIDLNNNTHNCESLSAVSVIIPPNNYRVVAKITLDGAISPSGFKKATFEVFYGEILTDWTINIGDSSSNNGYSGDSATQSNDSEMQIKGTRMSIYGNDYTPPGETIDGQRNLLHVENIVAPNDTVKLTVCNEYLAWNSPNATGELNSPYLYALNGQADNEGPINYDIYAAFNRVIANSGRNGFGVSWVRLRLFPECDDEIMGVELEQFTATTEQDNIRLNWITGTEIHNAGFRLWRGIEDGNGGYTDISFLEELTATQADGIKGELAPNTGKLISAVGNSTGSYYSFLDTSIATEGTYYYLLEDVDMDGTRTFYCEEIVATTIGKGPTIDLDLATAYCKQQIGIME